jgi:hypothetical protein
MCRLTERISDERGKMVLHIRPELRILLGKCLPVKIFTAAGAVMR